MNRTFGRLSWIVVVAALAGAVVLIQMRQSDAKNPSEPNAACMRAAEAACEQKAKDACKKKRGPAKSACVAATKEACLAEAKKAC